MKNLKLFAIVLISLIFFQCSKELDDDILIIQNENELQSQNSNIKSKIWGNNTIQPDQLI